MACTLLVLMAIVVAGCTKSEAAGEAARPSPTTTAATLNADRITMKCETRFGAGTDLPADVHSVLDSVAFSSTAAQTPDPVGSFGGRRFTKVGLRVRAGTAATLTIPASADTLMRWGNQNSGPLARVIDVPACPAIDREPWLVYPGGFYTTRPVCAPLTIKVAARSSTITLPFARSCWSG
jgi:hypothetical protein